VSRLCNKHSRNWNRHCSFDHYDKISGSMINFHPNNIMLKRQL